jgi:hypothetical protein
MATFHISISSKTQKLVAQTKGKCTSLVLWRVLAEMLEKDDNNMLESLPLSGFLQCPL